MVGNKAKFRPSVGHRTDFVHLDTIGGRVIMIVVFEHIFNATAAPFVEAATVSEDGA